MLAVAQIVVVQESMLALLLHPDPRKPTVPDGVIPQSELYDVYVAWDTTGRPLGKRRFNAKLARPGITKYKDSGTRSWKGFRYSTAGQEVYARVNQNRYGTWTS